MVWLIFGLIWPNEWMKPKPDLTSQSAPGQSLFFANRQPLGTQPWVSGQDSADSDELSPLHGKMYIIIIHYPFIPTSIGTLTHDPRHMRTTSNIHLMKHCHFTGIDLRSLSEFIPYPKECLSYYSRITPNILAYSC